MRSFPAIAENMLPGNYSQPSLYAGELLIYSTLPSISSSLSMHSIIALSV